MTNVLLRALRASAVNILACLFSIPVSLAAGAKYYVDFSNGSDGNKGTMTAPFQHCPGDPAARGHAADTALAPGDTVIFKGGVAYTGSIDCPCDGVAYDGNAAGTFGRGRAIIKGPDRATPIKGLVATGRSGLTFNHLDIESYGGHGSSPWTGRETGGRYGYGLYLDGCSRVTVEDCAFHDIGDWQNVPQANEGYMEGVGIAVIDGGSAIAIDRNDFTRIGRAGIMIEPKLGTRSCTGVTITRNDFHDYLRWGVSLATGNVHCTLSGITIDGNRFHDVYQYVASRWRGLPGDAPHVDGIIAYIGNLPPLGGQTLGTAANPITIRNNFFYNDAAAGYIQNAAIALDTWGGRTLVYGNIFVNTLYDGNGAVFCLEGTDRTVNPAPDYWICNNSFYDTTYAVTLESFRYPLTGGVHVLNNIFYKPDSGAGYSVRIMGAGSGPAQLDYNVYYTGRPDRRIVSAPAGHLTLRQLQADGYERHGRLADPGYRDIAHGLGSGSSANDLHLRTLSPAVDGAFNLSALFSTDKDGLARPAPPAAWDAGAYENARCLSTANR